MDHFTETDLKNLAGVRNEHCISLYMPSFRTGSDLQQNPIRFKNIISEAEQKLVTSGARPTEASEWLKPARKLLNDGNFWKNQQDSIVAFLVNGTMSIYRFPAVFPQLTVISNHFYLKPLLSIITGNTRFYLLDLDSTKIRLFLADRFMLTQIQSDILPASLDETLGFDNMEKNVQFSSQPSALGTNTTNVFGYGRQTDKHKVNILNYYHRVNDALKTILHNTNEPLLLSGVNYLHSIYREANTYPYIMSKGINQNIEHFTNQQILEKAWEIVNTHFEKIQKRDLKFYQQLNNEHNPVAVNDLKTIINGAQYGRIETLFVADGNTKIWGQIDDLNQEIMLHPSQLPGDEDLLDKAAVETMLKGGVVYILEPEQMPDAAPAAAILRY